MAQEPMLASDVANDVDMYEAVVDAVEGVAMVRESRAPVTVSVEQGVVTLTGVVISETMQQAVVYFVRTVPGVVKVIDQLYSDPKLRIAAAMAMANDPLTAVSQTAITITSYLGMVTLTGPDLPQDIQARAREVVASVPGVREVFTRFGVVSG